MNIIRGPWLQEEHADIASVRIQYRKTLFSKYWILDYNSEREYFEKWDDLVEYINLTLSKGTV